MGGRGKFGQIPTSITTFLLWRVRSLNSPKLRGFCCVCCMRVPSSAPWMAWNASCNGHAHEHCICMRGGGGGGGRGGVFFCVTHVEGEREEGEGEGERGCRGFCVTHVVLDVPISVFLQLVSGLGHQPLLLRRQFILL